MRRAHVKGSYDEVAPYLGQDERKVSANYGTTPSSPSSNPGPGDVVE